ncbi:MAG: hypothetical protein QM478_01970 [Flavobacteriaceae bacterium]
MKTIVLLNFIFILGGYFFDIIAFKSYTHRFGFNGVFKSNAEASYFYMLIITLFYISKEKYSRIFLAVGLLSTLFIGSKTLYFFLLIFGCLIVYNKVQCKIRDSYIKFFRAIFFIIAILIFSLGVVFIIKQNATLNRLYTDKGLFTAFLSTRDILVENAFAEMFTNWSFVHYFIGGIGSISLTTQTDFIDLFLNYGIIGSIIYIIIFILNTYSYTNLKVLLLVSPVLASMLLRGNFIHFPSVFLISMIIFVVINKIYKKEGYD